MTSTDSEPTTRPAQAAGAVPEQTAGASGARLSRLSILSWRHLSALYLWAAFTVVFAFVAPDTFLTEGTFRLVFSEGVVTSLLALAFLIPLACGMFDLSMGAVMALSLALSVHLQQTTSLSPVLGALIAIAAGGLVGGFSGFLIIKLRVDSFIATLGVSQVLLAVVILLSDNNQQTAFFPEYWTEAGSGDLLGVPLVLFYLLIIATLLWYVLEHTRIGRYLFATGGNREAARLAGVKTDQLIWGAFIASGVVSACAGIVYSMRVGVFAPSVGPGFLFPAVAAVFLGASQLSHRPNVWGTLIAYFALAFGVQGLVLSASSAATWSQPMFQGVSLIIAVAFAARPAVAKVRTQRRNGEAASSSGSAGSRSAKA